MSDGHEPNLADEDKPRRVKLVEGQEVSLGCGTLILIALIVMAFGRSSTNELEREVRGLRSDVGELKQAVETQTKQIEALQDKVDPAGDKE